MAKVCPTMKELNKRSVIKMLLNDKISGVQASVMLGYSTVHVSRLKKAARENGLDSLIRPPIPSSRKTPEDLKKTITDLYSKQYYDLNFCHFRDKLNDIHNIFLSYETIRQILIRNGIHTPKKQKVVHRRRRRMPKTGMLVQMDSSIHYWIPAVKDKWVLICAVDDATSEIIFAKFFPSDNLFNNMEVIRKIIELKGVFFAIYVDKASHFITTRYEGTHNNVNPDTDNTQIQYALESIGSSMINANSPQAKGRIERCFRTLQDRLIKELRLNNITDYASANSFLIKTFIPDYNRRFAVTVGVESAFKPLDPSINLDIVFSEKKYRIVNNDNTISYMSQIFQIYPSNTKISFAKSRVTVCRTEKNNIFILYKGKIVFHSKLAKTNKFTIMEKETECLLKKRQYALF